MNVVSNARADEPGDRPVSRSGGNGPTVLRIGLGARLRHKREVAGITRKRRATPSAARPPRSAAWSWAGSASRSATSPTCSPSTAWSTRRARRVPHPGRPGQRPRLVAPLLRPAAVLVRDLLGLEQAASMIRTYELQFVPGLLQTRGTPARSPSSSTRTPPRSSAASSCGCAARPSSPRPSRPQLWAVVDEAALRRASRARSCSASSSSGSSSSTGCRTSRCRSPRCARRPRRGGRPVHHPAVPRARPARHRLPRAAHQRPLPGQAGRRRPLRDGDGPAVRAGRAARPHRARPDDHPRGALAWPRSP